jgi:hypothetical protein
MVRLLIAALFAVAVAFAHIVRAATAELLKSVLVAAPHQGAAVELFSMNHVAGKSGTPLPSSGSCCWAQAYLWDFTKFGNWSGAG